MERISVANSSFGEGAILTLASRLAFRAGRSEERRLGLLLEILVSAMANRVKSKTGMMVENKKRVREGNVRKNESCELTKLLVATTEKGKSHAAMGVFHGESPRYWESSTRLGVTNTGPAREQANAWLAFNGYLSTFSLLSPENLHIWQ